VRSVGKYRIEWTELSARADAPSRRLAALREWQRAELVRLAFLDFATLPPAGESSARYTALAEFVVGAALVLAREKAPDVDQGRMAGFSILALGKLGAADLNFFSDLDLIFLAGEGDDLEACIRLARALVADLDARGGELIYRVDLRLRPEGDRGPLVCTQQGLEEYYEAYGGVWERCAWIRGRRVAGDQETAYENFQALQAFIYPRGLSPSSLGELFEQKSRAEEELISAADKEREMKRGRGGLREVEFPVLGLQLLHGATHPTLQTHDLRKAIRNLKILGILKAEEEQALLPGPGAKGLRIHLWGTEAEGGGGRKLALKNPLARSGGGPLRLAGPCAFRGRSLHRPHAGEFSPPATRAGKASGGVCPSGFGPGGVRQLCAVLRSPVAPV